MNAPTTLPLAIQTSQVESISNPAPTVYLHVALFMDDGSILSDETFRLVTFSGQESISELFEYQLELHANTTQPGQGTALDFNALMGRPITFAVTLPDTTAFEPNPTSFSQSGNAFQDALSGGDNDGFVWFNGIVASFGMGAPGVYQATVRPDLWRLTLANRYTIYQSKNVRDAMLAVLALHNISDVDTTAVTGLAIERTQDWFQAGETDYEFFRRMQGKSHLYFYFRHGTKSHQLVLSNNPQYPDAAMDRPLRYAYTATQELGLNQFDVISDYRYRQNLSIAGVQSLFTRQDESWQVDGVPCLHRFDSQPADTQGMPLVFQQHKVFQYGSSTDAAKAYGQLTALANQATVGQLSGESFCSLFKAGYTFSLIDYRFGDAQIPPTEIPLPIQPNLIGHQFVLTKVEHQGNLNGGYQNRFEATTVDGLVASFSLSDTQQGSILAEVVNNPNSWKYAEQSDFEPGQNIYKDNNPGTDQTELEAQGAYVRFATEPPTAPGTWVKLSAFMENVPEIGAQVIVSRASDESELPEIANIVHAGGNMTVNPSTWTANTQVGSSYNTRYGDGINIGFGRGMDNTTAATMLAKAVSIVSTAYGASAAYDEASPSSSAPVGTFRDAGYNQGASYGFSTANSLAASATQDLPTTYGSYGPTSDLLQVSESFGSTFNRSKGLVQSAIQDVGTSYNKSTIGKSENYNTVNGTSYTESTNNGKVTNISTINADSDSTTTQTGNSTDTRTNNGNITSTSTVNGNTSNTSTVTGTASSINHIGIQTTSNMMGINNSNDLIGLQNSNSLTGLSNQNSVTATALQMNATGISTQMSATGVNTQLSATGVNTSLSTSGVSIQINTAGTSVEYSSHGAGFRAATEPAVFECSMKGLKTTLLSALDIKL